MFFENRLEQAAVGVPARAVENGVVLAEESGDVGLELLVDVLSAANEPDRRHAVAPAAQAFLRGFDDGGMVGEAEVVVGAEVDDFSSADADGRALRSLQLALALVKALGLQVGELGAELITETLIAHVGLLHCREAPRRRWLLSALFANLLENLSRAHVAAV